MAAEFLNYFDTKFNTLSQIEPILHKFEDLKIANFLNPEEVYFLVTRIIYGPTLILPNLQFLLYL